MSGVDYFPVDIELILDFLPKIFFLLKEWTEGELVCTLSTPCPAGSEGCKSDLTLT